MENAGDAMTIRDIVTGTLTVPPMASGAPGAKVVGTQPSHPGNSSAVAMSILYSITGLITLLFLLIIATGAVRAHRNPERYGPRTGANGRPRRSRARGLAMAMLETLPIVKFGESDQKADEENALETIPSSVAQQHDAAHGEIENAPNDVAVPESSTKVAKNTDSHHAPVTSTPLEVDDKQDDKQQPKDDPLGCPICTEDFTVGEDVRVLPCDHKFHPACVDPWLVNVSGTCPLCRLDLRPPEEPEREEGGEDALSPEGVTAAADGTLASPTRTEQAFEPNRRRRSRLLDWNRLRHAPVDERVQILRLYRQFQQGSEPTTGIERRHSRISHLLRERFHIRGDSHSGTASPENTPVDSEPAASQLTAYQPTTPEPAASELPDSQLPASTGQTALSQSSPTRPIISRPARVLSIRVPEHRA